MIERIKEECPDIDIFDECFLICRVDYLQCRAECNSALCETDCSTKFGGCENSICSIDECEEAEIENDDFIQCREEALAAQASCIRSCPPEQDCFEICNQKFLENLNICPCVQEKTTTTAITTTVSTSAKRLLVMGRELSQAFSISFDGTEKTAAIITAPDNNFIDGGPFALVKGNLYIFGGYFDDRQVM
ncbi:Oidioi.mRNA.OKI2018_I69.chr2.g8307.t1.cds [Oikopleura dioica]|uniref:Oidioi.mRNA.OKI2018_I69.chr2.g8307.t1.cds n=1 Tax=Oikopleura dioica TaxID=34765 RepID=A0ABN7TF33_OIKDI|nr:Oidioi.mRNA.OKI2018_I69.chr2.g8307.t1.cds [Oikopleura dioica]